MCGGNGACGMARAAAFSRYSHGASSTSLINWKKRQMRVKGMLAVRTRTLIFSEMHTNTHTAVQARDDAGRTDKTGLNSTGSIQFSPTSQQHLRLGFGLWCAQHQENLMPATTPEELGRARLKEVHGNLHPGDPLWLRSKNSASERIYERSKLLKVVSGLTVSVQAEGGEPVEVAIAELLPGNNAEAEDICTLLHLNEATILDNVCTRFAKQQVYTWTSTILIAMNPFEARPELYSDEVRQRYIKGPSSGTQPHVYAIVEAAYRGILLTKYRPQALVVSGESGAGTEPASVPSYCVCAASSIHPTRTVPPHGR
jgi:hypothetical protein